MADSKLERLMNVIAFLSDTSVPVTLREIIKTVPGYSENYDTARRTFERDKDVLRSMNFDVQVIEIPSGDKGYKIEKDTTYFDIELSPTQRSILEYALSLYGPDKDLVKTAITKLGGSNPENEIGQVTSLSLPNNFDELYQKCNEKKSISILFKDNWRNITPIRLVARDGYWYCEAIDIDKNAKRTFRLDRIEEIGDTQKEVSSDATLDDDEESIFVELSCHPQLLNQVVREFNGQINSDGHVSVKLSRKEILFARIYEYAGFVSVVEPKHLYDELKELQESLLKDLKVGT